MHPQPQTNQEVRASGAADSAAARAMGRSARAVLRDRAGDPGALVDRIPALAGRAGQRRA